MHSTRSGRPGTYALQPSAAVIGGRYEVLSELGGGGMAVVHLVRDRQTGQQLALKRPLARGSIDQQHQAHELFAREYHTLAQLAHPRIVEVYDYAIDNQGPFYTMELLDGGDLQQLVPIDSLRACAIARDVCSALSLLHSRRIVHRDVSPRNVRCTRSGIAKLIDFGAMSLMGPSKELVGTPVYCAPEVVHLQPLDARTDLYALGATLYYALTGHHAYPARDFTTLPNAWRFGIARPSELVAQIPEALDALVLDLLQLEPENRPSGAAEVMERLAAIEGRPVDEQLLVAQSYLTTPGFVGREAELARVRTKTMRAVRKRGGAVLVHGPAGSGRSRFLDASVLAGKLAGTTVLRADADDAQHGEYGAMRALIRQLARTLPEQTAQAAQPELSVLAHVVPELAEGSGVTPEVFTDPNARRPRLQSAIQRLFVDVSQVSPLLIVADDLDRLDEPSTAAIALLARSLRANAILIVATDETGATPLAASAHRLFAEAASQLELPPLEQREVKTLLESVFGASTELEGLVQRAYVLSRGNPRDVMRLAQHLVDHGVVRYRAGAWSVPGRIESHALPASVAQMLAARSHNLGEPARLLGAAFALCPEDGFSFEECATLGAVPDHAQTVRDLEQLTKASILRAAGERFVLTDRAFCPVLLEGLPETTIAGAHRRLATVFEARPNEEFRVAQHLLRAGEHERALDLLVAYAVTSQERTDRSPEAFYDLLRSLPENWLRTYEDALTLARELGRPERQIHDLQHRLAGLGAIIGQRDTEHTPQLIARLRAACGLDDWAALDPSLEPMPRLIKALEQTQARYDATPVHARVLEPVHALRAIARAEITTVGLYVTLLDVPSLRALPSLQPLAVLSPALGVVDQLVQGVLLRLTGRTERARELYVELLARTDAPDRAGLDEAHHHTMRVRVMSGLGMIDAAMGLRSSLEWASKIENDPLFKPNASLTRMLHHLWEGNCHQADALRGEVEVLRIQSSGRQVYENAHLLWQVAAHAAMEDLTRLKHTLEEIVQAAGDHPGWQPVLAYARAEYQRVRGDAAAASESFRAALETTRAGDHQIWANLAGAHVHALDDAGHTERAVTAGIRYLAEAEQAGLGFVTIYVLLPLCVAQAKLNHPDAVKNADRVIARLRELGSGGLNLGLAYEARARVALARLDQAGYDEYSALCAEVFARANNPALVAKVRRLRREAQRKELAPAAAQLNAATSRGIASTILKSKLRAAADAESRARIALAILAEQSGASNGVLYRVTDDGPVWSASIGEMARSDELDTMVREYIDGEAHGHDAVTGGDGDADSEIRTEWSSFGDALYRPVLLSHYVSEGYAITGIAVFAVPPGQPFHYPGETAAQLSRLAADSGDVTAIPLIAD